MKIIWRPVVMRTLKGKIVTVGKATISRRSHEGHPRRPGIRLDGFGDRWSIAGRIVYNYCPDTYARGRPLSINRAQAVDREQRGLVAYNSNCYAGGSHSHPTLRGHSPMGRAHCCRYGSSAFASEST